GRRSASPSQRGYTTMSHVPNDHDSGFSFKLPPRAYLRRLAIIIGASLIGCLVVFLLLWRMFFLWVPPEHHFVIVTKHRDPLKPGQVLAEAGQKGIQREVKGEGWHLVWPIIYATEVRPNTIIKPGKLGIVTARGGDEPTGGRVLALEGERGIQKHVLPPGS